MPVIIQNKRYWIEFYATHEIWTSARDYSELRKIVFKDITITNVFEDYEVAYNLKRTISSLLSQGYNPKHIIKEVSQLYGIREEYLYDIIFEVMQEFESINREEVIV